MGKSKTYNLGSAVLKYQIIRIFKFSDVKLQEFCHVYVFPL
jgi:hypothetical protein